MSVMKTILMRMFGRPRGGMGRLGGYIMALTNTKFGVRVCDLVGVAANDRVLEVGFGPGAVVDHLSKLTTGYVAGVDSSPEMVAQARARNRAAIQSGLVDLRLGSVDSLPFGDNSFDKALAINSMQVWPNAVAGLREIRRVLKPGATIALGFTVYSGQSKNELPETLALAGFTKTHLVTTADGFCALATKP